MYSSCSAGFRFFFERQRTEEAAGWSLGGTDGSTSKAEVVAKSEFSDDPEKI
jgi:hypothetical protein